MPASYARLHCRPGRRTEWLHGHLLPPFHGHLCVVLCSLSVGHLCRSCFLHLCCFHVPCRLITHNSAPDGFLPTGNLLSQAPAGIMSMPLFNKSEFISLTISDHRLVSC